LFTDSQNAKATVLNLLNSARTRNIDIRYKYILDAVKKGKVDIRHISGNEMVADGLTKALKSELHTRFVKLLGLCKAQGAD